MSILLKSGAFCDIQNSDGATPLHLATINGASNDIVYNLAKDKSTLVIKDNKGKFLKFLVTFYKILIDLFQRTFSL